MDCSTKLFFPQKIQKVGAASAAHQLENTKTELTIGSGCCVAVAINAHNSQIHISPLVQRVPVESTVRGDYPLH